MLRKGFTLAEVLITVGIIGVVAALSTPAIMRNTQNAKVGPQLAKLVATLETGIQAMCTDQEKMHFKDTKTRSGEVTMIARMDQMAGLNSANTENNMPVTPFIRARKIDDSKFANVTKFGTTASQYTLVTQDKLTYYQFPDKSAIGVTDCVADPGTHCPVYAYLPGFAKKTKLLLGKDAFIFFVNSNGDIVLPEEYLDTGSDSCLDTEVLGKTTSGFYCLDRIAENGWKVPW